MRYYAIKEFAMHFVDAKSILSAKNGMNIYGAVLTAVFIAIHVLTAIICGMILKILK